MRKFQFTAEALEIHLDALLAEYRKSSTLPHCLDRENTDNDGRRLKMLKTSIRQFEFALACELEANAKAAR